MKCFLGVLISAAVFFVAAAHADSTLSLKNAHKGALAVDFGYFMYGGVSMAYNDCNQSQPWKDGWHLVVTKGSIDPSTLYVTFSSGISVITKTQIISGGKVKGVYVESSKGATILNATVSGTDGRAVLNLSHTCVATQNEPPTGPVGPVGPPFPF